MTSNESKNEMLVMVLMNLGELCRSLAENPAVPAELRTQAQRFAEEFDSLLPYRRIGTPAQHAQGEKLLIRIARFLPRLVDVGAQPASPSTQENVA